MRIYKPRPTSRTWRVEFREFLQDIRLGRTPRAGLVEAAAALAVVEQVYAANPETMRKRG